MPQSDRIQMLEESLVFQQRMIDQLNEVIIALRGDLDRLQFQFEQQQSKLRWLSESVELGENLPDEKPPHY